MDDDAGVLSEGEWAAAQAVLARAWGDGATLVGAEVVWERPHVVRLRAADGRTAILKRPRDPGDSLWGGEPEGFATEWAALAFLGGLDAAAGLAPGLLGGDAGHRLFVMAELPRGRSLAAALLGDDADVAAADLVAYAQALGTLHAASFGRRAELHAARQARGLAAGRSWWATKVAAGRDAFVADLTDAPADADRLAAEVDEVVRTLDGAGGDGADGTGQDGAPLGPVGLVHGDPCPDNVSLVDGRCRLFDFERAGWGSVAADAAYLLAPFPSCWCFGGMPPAAVAAAWRAYEGVLAEAGADLGPGWERAVAAALAGYLVNGAAWALPDRHDEDWGTTTRRPRLVAWAESFLAAPGAGAFPALAAAASRLGDRLVPAGAAPVAYPALPVPGATTVVPPDYWSPSA